MKKKVIIWGTKAKARRICHFLNDEYAEIIAFTDSMCNEKYEFGNKIEVMPLYDALTLEYDYIVIASTAWDEITERLRYEGVDDSKIVQIYNYHFTIPNTLFFYDDIDINQEKMEIFRGVSCALFERG